MKKLVIIVLLLASVSTVFGQMKRDRTTAYNYWIKKNYEKAKEYIDKAIAYPEASADAKVWYYKGGIYLDIYTSGKSEELAPNALNEAYDAFNKSIAVDTKNQYTDDARTQISGIAGEFFNQGLKNFQNEKFDAAIINFEKAIDLNGKNNVVDTMSYYALGLTYRGKAATDSTALVKAISNFQKIVDMNSNKQEIYIELISLYITNNQFDKANEILALAKSKFPNNTSLTIAEANLYLQSGDFENAVKKLEEATALDPQNYQIYHALGSSYDRMRSSELTFEQNDELFKKAVNSYNKAIELKPDFFDAIFNVGVMYYNLGGDIVNQANQLPISEVEKYDELSKIGSKYLEQSLPFLEKCYNLQPNDQATISSLKEIYTRLKLYDKLKELNSKLQ